MIFRDREIYNTFSLKAVAETYLEYCSADELARELPQAPRPWLHVGGGSNLLFASERVGGTVFHNACNAMEVLCEDSGSVLVKVGGGVVWDFFVERAVSCRWYGAENLSLIPGEVGAAAVQNIGAYGAEAQDIIESVETFDTQRLRLRVFEKEECRYGYRSSFFKSEEGRRYFVISVNMRLSKIPRFNLGYGALKDLAAEDGLTLRRVREKIIGIRREKLPDPEQMGSAGSFFMNPVVSQEKYRSLAAEYPDMPHYPASDGMVKLSAGWMIDRCGFKGRSMGRAGVYGKQALVLVNLGGATAQEIIALARAVVEAVEGRFGVRLKAEVQLVE